MLSNILLVLSTHQMINGGKNDVSYDDILFVKTSNLATNRSNLRKNHEMKGGSG